MWHSRQLRVSGDWGGVVRKGPLTEIYITTSWGLSAPPPAPREGLMCQRRMRSGQRCERNYRTLSGKAKMKERSGERGSVLSVLGDRGLEKDGAVKGRSS